MSSALQCLFHTKELVEYFFSKDYTNDLYNTKKINKITKIENLPSNKINGKKNSSNKNIDNLNIENNTFSFIIDVEYKDSTTIKLNESLDNIKTKEFTEIKNFDKFKHKNSEYLEKNNFNENKKNKEINSNNKIESFIIKIDNNNEEDKFQISNEESYLNVNTNEAIQSKSILEFSETSYCIDSNLFAFLFKIKF